MENKRTGMSIIAASETMKKTVFNIQIHLSENQLKKLCEMAGDDEFNYLESYYELVKSNPDHVFDDDPSFSCGIGADINDILSLGFTAMNAMKDYGKIKLSKEDLHFHPFRISYPEFTKVECKEIPFKNTSIYEPMTYAIDPSAKDQHIDLTKPTNE